MKNKLKYLYVVTAGCLWGIISLFLKPLLNMGFTHEQTVSLRCLIAAVLLGIIMVIKDKSLFKIKLKDLWCFLGTGLLSLLFFSLSYFHSMTYNGVCVAVILLYTSPVFVMLFSLVLFKEKVTGKKIIALFLTMAGCVLVSGISGGQSIGVKGIILGLCSGVGYALYSIFSRYALQRSYDSMTISFYTFLFCGVSCLPFSDVGNMIFNLSPKSGFYALGLGFVCTVLAYLFYTKGLQYVENSKASIIVAVEPVIASVIGVLVYNEEITLIKLSGIILVLTALVICSKD